MLVCEFNVYCIFTNSLIVMSLFPCGFSMAENRLVTQFRFEMFFVKKILGYNVQERVFGKKANSKNAVNGKIHSADNNTTGSD